MEARTGGRGPGRASPKDYLSAFYSEMRSVIVTLIRIRQELCGPRGLAAMSFACAFVVRNSKKE
jgi:hypothetical protein